jgi:hypothetical protein
MWYPWY